MRSAGRSLSGERVVSTRRTAGAETLDSAATSSASTTIVTVLMRTVCALLSGLVVLGALAACSQRTQPPETAPTAASGIEGATPAASAEARFNPTEAVGGGALSSTTVSADEITRAFASVPQASQLRFTANSSPPGATGADVATISIVGQDSAGLLTAMDAGAKQSLGDAMLTAAGTAWPNASISLLVTGAAGGGTIIGQRPKGGPNNVIAT